MRAQFQRLSAYALESAICASGRTMSSLVDKWKVLRAQGHELNPCGSKLHPAHKAGVDTNTSTQRSLQSAYTPESTCFGCGPAAGEYGMHLQSFRAENGGLEARMTIPASFCAFPGVINGGAISTLLDCHGNWTAAIELMDRSHLPRPPLTVTYSMLVTYREPTAPDTPLVIRSKVTNVRQKTSPVNGKATVEVDIALYEEGSDGIEKLLVTASGIFKRMGALRAL